ncbi:17383_t:CDS:1, partial [Acaulospora morrowiae]
MNFNLPEKLSPDYHNLFENSNKYNVIIEVGEAPFNKTYKTHSVILSNRCPFLYRELQRISCNKGDTKFISKKHIPIKAFDVII